ncbi:MAG TPA: P1 family peptidase [Acidobacteriota bacterium]|jgi:L-aminopeptidase/D-esterase-like protein
MKNAGKPQTKNAAVSSYAGGLCDVDGVKVGHFTETRRPTGCTVVLVGQGAVAGVDVRGGAPGTRETDALNPLNLVQEVNAVLLAGGSAFGLEAAGGVSQYLEEKGFGFETRAGRVPIVPAAVLIDLSLGDPKIRPDKAAGYAACQNATSGKIAEGNVGAGAGATVGKWFGLERAMKGGVGSASIKTGGLVVAALMVVNAVGDVYDPGSGKILAGARTPDGKGFANTMESLKKNALPWQTRKHSEASFGRRNSGGIAGNTTIGVVATNAAFDKTEMTKIAQMAHDGLARAINPVHTPMDGDTIFAISTGKIETRTNASGFDSRAALALVGSLAAEATAQAIVRAVLMAEPIPAFPSARQMKRD